MYEVSLIPHATSALEPMLGDDCCQRLDEALDRQLVTLAGRTIWHVNSTAQGGGVAEMLTALLPYASAAGVEVHWLVLRGDAEFFTVTKRLHNYLHESAGDGGPLDEHERAVYDRNFAGQVGPLRRRVRPGDVVVLHDPQTAGLIRPLLEHGACVIWRCHIGVDHPGPAAHHAWDFLRGDVQEAHACVFSRAAYVWDGLPPERVVIMAPCIDVAAPKNMPLETDTRDAVLAVSGIIPGPGRAAPAVRYFDADGIERSVKRRASMVEDVPLSDEARVVLQVSRWDHLKDPVGVLAGFALYEPLGDADLVLAGPSAGTVADDPEAAKVFGEVRRAWQQLPRAIRCRVHLARLPMDDLRENAVIVNALQRRADVVVQKSLAEGFGLTVAEAMWKRRPVVASRVGGVQDQIVDGESGVLLAEPRDLATFGAAVTRLLLDDALARQMGVAAQERVRDNYLPVHHFEHEADLLAAVVPPSPAAGRGRRAPASRRGNRREGLRRRKRGPLA